MKSRLIYLFLLFLSPMMVALSPIDPRIVYVQSWKKGQSRIQEQKLSIQLDQRKPRYRIPVRDSSGENRYTVIVEHIPPKVHRHEYWWVRMYENDGKNRNLIQEEGPGPNKHNYPKGDYVGVIYPLENPPTDVFEMIKLNTGLWIYPIMAKRVIKIESFYCVIQVIEYKRNSIDRRKIDSLNMEVTFTNNYEVPK